MSNDIVRVALCLFPMEAWQFNKYHLFSVSQNSIKSLSRIRETPHKERFIATKYIGIFEVKNVYFGTSEIR
jgi:hypothetical protein